MTRPYVLEVQRTDRQDGDTAEREFRNLTMARLAFRVAAGRRTTHWARLFDWSQTGGPEIATYINPAITEE